VGQRARALVQVPERVLSRLPLLHVTYFALRNVIIARSFLPTSSTG
jgi:hypothetical protein